MTLKIIKVVGNYKPSPADEKSFAEDRERVSKDPKTSKELKEVYALFKKRFGGRF